MKNKKLKIRLIPKRGQRGATAILMSLFVLMIILLVASAAASIMVFEIRMSGEIANSIPAFYAADAGAEQCLYQARRGTTGDPCFTAGGSITSTLANNASYRVTRTTDTQIDSNGRYSQTSRSVQLTW